MAKKDAQRRARKLRLDRLRAHVLVCTGGSCAARSEQRQSLKEARREIKALGLDRGPGRVLCTSVGCLGVCRSGPIAVVWPDGIFYRKATPGNLRHILREHAAGGRVVEELCIARPGDPREDDASPPPCAPVPAALSPTARRDDASS